MFTMLSTKDSHSMLSTWNWERVASLSWNDDKNNCCVCKYIIQKNSYLCVNIWCVCSCMYVLRRCHEMTTKTIVVCVNVYVFLWTYMCMYILYMLMYILYMFKYVCVASVSEMTTKTSVMCVNTFKKSSYICVYIIYIHSCMYVLLRCREVTTKTGVACVYIQIFFIHTHVNIYYT